MKLMYADQVKDGDLFYHPKLRRFFVKDEHSQTRPEYVTATTLDQKETKRFSPGEQVIV